MPKMTREHMLTVLARDGMGWKVYRDPAWLEKPRRTCAARPNGESVILFYDPPHKVPAEFAWSPDTDGGAAWELWMAMRRKPRPIWLKFVNIVGNYSSHQSCPEIQSILEGITPALITRAAFEALEASHDTE